jgi:hypothetical protein
MATPAFATSSRLAIESEGKRKSAASISLCVALGLRIERSCRPRKELKGEELLEETAE